MKSKQGLLQGDTLASFLFITVLDCLRMAILDDRAHKLGFNIKPRQSRRTGKQTITDLVSTNDLALLSDTVEQAQEILLVLEEEATKVGLYIYAQKTQYMSFN